MVTAFFNITKFLEFEFHSNIKNMELYPNFVNLSQIRSFKDNDKMNFYDL